MASEREQREDSDLVATFLLGDAAFGISAARVQEVVKVGELTPVHHAAPEVVGIRNLRGHIITVLDLRTRLELGQVELGSERRILIVDWQGEQVGLLVDAVSDTLTVNLAEVTPPPPNLHGVQSRHLRGIYRTRERLLALIDPDTLLEVEQRSEREEAVRS